MQTAKPGVPRRGIRRALGVPVLLPLALIAALLIPAVQPAAAAVGVVRVSVGSASMVEGDGGTRNLYFAVTLSRPKSANATVKFTTSPGTAVAGTDYTTVSTVVTIPANTTTALVAVPIIGNTTVDAPTRSFGVKLSAPAGAWLARSTATGTIVDDDPFATSRLSISSATVVASNANTSVRFSITASKRRTTAISVAYATHAASATDGIDFVGTAGRVTIPAGSTGTSATVTVRPNGGTRGAAVEAFTMKLSGATGATIDKGTGTATIRRDGYPTANAWSQRGGDSGLTGYAPAESTLTAANVGTVHQLWSVTLPWENDAGLSPVSDGTAAYVVKADAVVPQPAYGHLTAFDLSNGHELWSVAAANDDRQRNLALSDGLVITVGLCPGQCLRAYHASDGTLAWSYLHGTTPFLTDPTIANGIVYIGDQFGILEIDLATGKVTGGVLNDWDYQTAVAGGRIFRGDWVYDATTHQKLWNPPFVQQIRVTDGASVFSNEDQRLVARAAGTGVEQWGANVACAGSPAAVSPTVVVVQGCQSARAFNRQTGAALWGPYALHGVSDLQPTIANGLVYINDESGFLDVLNLTTGALAKEIDINPNVNAGSPVVVNGKILLYGYSLQAYGN